MNQGLQGVPSGKIATASVITAVDQTSPVYILREPYGAYAWTILRGDAKRATPANNSTYPTSSAAWTNRTTLTYA